MVWYKPSTWFQKSLDTGSDSSTVSETFDNYLRGEQGIKGVKVPLKSAYYYYESVSHLADAISKIVEKAKQIRFGIADGSTEEVDYNHELLIRLKSPGEGAGSQQFKGELLKSFLLTSEGWVVARGNVSAPPLALLQVMPYEVDITVSNDDGMPTSIKTTSKKDKRTYTRSEIGGKIRYFSKDMLSEVIPIIGETGTSQEWRGQSRLSSLLDDLEQARAGKRHNLSLLKNGAKPSMVVGPKTPERAFTKDVVDDLVKWFRAFTQGENNAGNVAVASEALDINPMGMTNTDMDYIELLKSSETATYNRYDIPLSVVSTAAMTMDNYTIGQRALYTEAVFPAFMAVFGPLLEALSPRYRDLDNKEFKIDEISVPALRETHINQMLSLRNTRSVELNEVRRIGGYEDIPGGDQVLIGANEVPLMAIDTAPIDMNSPVGVGITDDIQGEALNGAQVSALSGLVESVSLGTLSRASAIALARAAFPAISEDLIQEMFGNITAGATSTEDE